MELKMEMTQEMNLLQIGVKKVGEKYEERSQEVLEHYTDNEMPEDPSRKYLEAAGKIK